MRLAVETRQAAVHVEGVDQAITQPLVILTEEVRREDHGQTLLMVIISTAREEQALPILPLTTAQEAVAA